MPLTPPTLDEFRNWLSLDPEDQMDDAMLQESLDAAVSQQGLVVTYPLDAFSEPTMTPNLREAVFLRAQRLAARRNSPEGIVGISGAGEFVTARVPAYDTDVAALETPHRVIPVA